MSGLTINTLAQQIEDLIGKSEQQTKAVAAWLGGSATGGPNNDGRYPFVDLSGHEILVPSPAAFSDMTSGPAAQADVAKVAAELARDLAQGHADRSDAQRILSEAARGAAVDARNLAQEHRNHAGTHEANARYWAELAQGSGQSSSEDREIVEQLAAETADNAALAAQDADDAAASAALAATFDPNLFDKKSDTLSATRLVDMIDPARIPVLVGQTPIVSTGGIPNLTAQQQTGVMPGTLVATTDGRRWVYSGTGSKTAEASYIEQGDVTPIWDVIANKPNRFPTNIANVAGLQSALDAKAPIANPVFNTINVNGTVWGYSFAANSSLFYPDGNHTVIKTGAAGAEKYWRFDQNGWLYGLSGGLYIATNAHIAGDQLRVGLTDSGSRADLNRGWLELRNDSNGYGPYIDLSANNAADYHARMSWAGGRFDLISTTSLQMFARGANNHVRATSETGKQNGDVLTEGGAEQILGKQLTFPSGKNPQDAGAGAMLEVRGEGSGYGAWMKFHRPGAYGTYFGMFEDGKWGFGGWSAGATIYEFWTSKNLDANGLMRRYCDGWNTTTDGNERFYFATNGRSYYRSRSGHQWRNSADQPMMTLENDGVLDVAAHLAVRGSAINLYGGSPTIRFMDSDNRTAHIHVNSNRFYVLRGAGTNDSGWATVPNKGWPLEIDLETNHATFGGSIYLNSEWLRIHGQTGVYWETYGGGWHMTDTGWIRAYGSKGIYTAGQVRGGTVVGESDRRLKTNIATITDATQKVEALTGVTFDWKRTGSAGMGFIAQDFEQVIPALVTEDTDGMKGVEYGPVVALLVEALKETNARVTALEGGRV